MSPRPVGRAAEVAREIGWSSGDARVDAALANRRRNGMLPREKVPPTRAAFKSGGCGCGGAKS